MIIRHNARMKRAVDTVKLGDGPGAVEKATKPDVPVADLEDSDIEDVTAPPKAKVKNRTTR